MSKDLIEERFFTTNRWVTGRECLNLQNINDLPQEYSGTLKSWLIELTTFIYLYENEWIEIYKEYQDIVHVQLREDQKTARKEGAMTSSAVLRRFCMMMKKYDEKYSDKPMKRFIMANEHDISRIEKMLFEKRYEK